MSERKSSQQTGNEERFVDEETKRQRTNEYWQKRHEQKELETEETLEHGRFLIKMEALRKTAREQQLGNEELIHFADSVERVNELYLQTICRNVITKWRKHTIRANVEQMRQLHENGI